MLDTVSHWIPLVSLTLNLLFAAGAWVLARTVVSRGDFDALKNRVAIVEAQIEKAPGWSMMNDIKDRLAQLDGTLKGVNATLAAHVETAGHMRQSIDTIQSYLLQERGK